MCGICGVVYGDRARPVDRATLEAMTRLMAHRGPDGEGFHIDGPVGLGHRRLSVIDIEAGVQPMTNEDGTLRLVYNGEIYNFRELAAGLAALGHRFATRCDTEVILHLYEELGPACLGKLRGMFSFALWDGKRRRLFCARDRLGVKPFFYRFAGGDFIFASGPEPILRHPGAGRRVDTRALDLYLTYQYVPAPLTIYEGMRKLPPAHFLLLDDGRLSVERYWEVNPEREAETGYDEARERLRELLTEATRLRLVSDVPLGAFLSGGIDSSIVVALMSGLSDRPVKTFSIGFEEGPYNELPYARAIAERYGTDHHELVVRPDAIELLPRLVRHFGEPFADSSQIPTYLVSQLARHEVTVALSGDGGDELFAGYPRFRHASNAWQRTGRVPAPLRRGAALLLTSVPGATWRRLGDAAAHRHRPPLAALGLPVGGNDRRAGEVEATVEVVIDEGLDQAVVVGAAGAAVGERPDVVGQDAIDPGVAFFQVQDDGGTADGGGLLQWRPCPPCSPPPTSCSTPSAVTSAAASGSW